MLDKLLQEGYQRIRQGLWAAKIAGLPEMPAHFVVFNAEKKGMACLLVTEDPHPRSNPRVLEVIHEAAEQWGAVELLLIYEMWAITEENDPRDLYRSLIQEGRINATDVPLDDRDTGVLLYAERLGGEHAQIPFKLNARHELEGAWDPTNAEDCVREGELYPLLPGNALHV